MKDIIVAKDHSGDFLTVQEAVNSIAPDNTVPVTIFMKSGRYEEKLTIDRPFITLVGEDSASTVLTFHDYANMIMEDGSKRGTFRSYSCFIDTHDFTARNLTFENPSGLGRIVGQALALYVDGDRILFDGCRFLGHQDTLFTGPLPPTVVHKNGFVGPKEFAPRINGRHYYRDCMICGDVDFIFGSATAYFEHCELVSLANIDKEGENHGYVTAASTPEGQEYGYVFYQCHFTGDCPPRSVYLGRPWRNYAKTVLLECTLEEHIKEEGWHDWKKEEAHSQTFYAEYKSTGAGAAPEKRVFWSHQLDEVQAALYSKDRVLGDWEV